ncbi:MAG TPA: trypsin-like peptidase domain-containing protein [Gammaproteobacteria bacterium]|nr:trypsin-like peptidase domain-containing protein [Gammaproteobacteria bacterium]
MKKTLASLCLWLLAAGSVSAAPDNEQQWTAALARVSPSVVSIRVDATRAFDTEWNLTGQASGFVVDAKRGIILTNRHVVTPGPVVAEAVFQDHEVVTLKPLYRDPVHDFGFYQYDPKALKYIQPVSLRLAPDQARVGEEIRIIGNDAGEQQSILSGTLARTDRDAPNYGAGNYSDFNTFYFQAVSGTTGGSSGSPVININGDVIALNAGARNDAASSYFLPLDRVRRALELIESDSQVSRGTLQTIFRHEYYDGLERLGLLADTEAALRKQHPQATGLLVVNQIVPGGPCDGKLQAGDILLSVDGTDISGFVPLEQILDQSVGKPLSLKLNRAGTPITVQVTVQDLNDITPASYLEFGGATLNDLSYEQARNYNVPAQGVYVANPGYVFGTAGVGRASVITSFDGVPVHTLDDFQQVLTGLPDRAHAVMRYFGLSNSGHSSLAVVTVDRSWFPAQRCQRDDRTGVWPCTALPPAPAGVPPVAASVSFPHYDDARMKTLAPSLVYINFDMPYPVDGVAETHYVGSGVIVDVKRGLVVTDRDTVPVAMGDVRLTFAGSLEIPARVRYVNPLHDLVVLQYDPKLIGSTPVKAARFSAHAAQPGDTTWLTGFQPDDTLTSQQSRVASIDPVVFPLSRTFRFRDTNLEVLSLVNAPSNVTGVLTDAAGRVTALWAGFAYEDSKGQTREIQRGIAADVVRDTLRIVESDGREPLRSLDVEFYPIALSQARKLGLPDTWIARLEAAEPGRRQALAVARLTAGTPAAELLQTGDLLLALDGHPAVSFRAVEKVSQRPELKLTLLRAGRVITLKVATVALDGQGTQRILVWAGALLQKPQHGAAAQRAIPGDGLLVGYYNYGSPASRYGLLPGLRIVAVNGRATPDMDSFIAASHALHDGDIVRLSVTSWDGMNRVITLKLDLRYWPTYEVVHGARGWTRTMQPGLKRGNPTAP